MMFPKALRASCRAALYLVLCTPVAQAAKSVVVYNFTGGADGATPLSTLVPDGHGNVYGTTSQGGDPACGNCGTIFKLDKIGAFTTLHLFEGGLEGLAPHTGVSLIRGLLYGNAPIEATTGTTTSVIYSMNPDGSNYTIQYAMTGPQGGELVGLLQPSPSGGLFGLGLNGGVYSRGTMFYLTATNKLAIAHSFAGGTDGQHPSYLIEDAAHNLFGSTQNGGAGCQAGTAQVRNGCGIIFKYVPKTRTYSVLYACANGADGYAPLIGSVGPDGTVYGVTTRGGANNHGALFALTPTAGGYSFSVLTPIKTHGNDDALNPPVLSPDGALAGGTNFGGNYRYQDGRYSILYNTAQPEGQFLVPPGHPDAILSTSLQNGTSAACKLEGGCGFIYYVRQ